ncbi:MAG: hypothetical protein ACTS9Y_01185 [Methylophilus sp.]|uniref:hypothetical protein n=1 Tax=Methylophilus sp. TaxID=29541 RepID=UPI003FA136B1
MPFIKNMLSKNGFLMMGVFAFLFLMMLSGILAGSAMFFTGTAFIPNPQVKWWGWTFSISGAAYAISSVGYIIALVYFFFSGNVKVIKYIRWYCYVILVFMVVFTISGIGSGSTNAVGYLFKILTATTVIVMVRYLSKESTTEVITSWFSAAK